MSTIIAALDISEDPIGDSPFCGQRLFAVDWVLNIQLAWNGSVGLLNKCWRIYYKLVEEVQGFVLRLQNPYQVHYILCERGQQAVLLFLELKIFD